MNDPLLEKRVREKLREVMDPETGLDVLAMGVVKKISCDTGGAVSLLFVPSSPACPLAFRIALDMREAVMSVGGVTRAEIEVDGYWRSEELKRVLEETGGA